nr:MAG TPA: hypothetical protein [Caudoviricetes sp.]
MIQTLYRIILENVWQIYILAFCIIFAIISVCIVSHKGGKK